MKQRADKILMIAVVAVMALMVSAGNAFANEKASGVTPDQALQMLVDGNARFVGGKSQAPNLSLERKQDTSKNGQHPFATIIGCSDSRAPIELIFDQGIGDIFTIRVAGNVSDTDEIGSIEYGVDHLGTPLMVVLGHTQCGAVTAVVTNAEVHGSIPALVDNIIPAAEKARAKLPDAEANDLIPEAIVQNVWQSIEDLLANSEAVKTRAKSGQVMIVGAVYHLDTGKVEWLGRHPGEATLLAAAPKQEHSASHE